MKKKIRLTESDLRKMVAESVRQIIREKRTSDSYRFDSSDNYGYVEDTDYEDEGFDPSDNYGPNEEMSPEEEREYMRILDTNWEVHPEKLYDEVCSYLSLNPNVTSWEEIAEDFRYDIDELPPDDVEILKDTIEAAMRNYNS